MILTPAVDTCQDCGLMGPTGHKVVHSPIFKKPLCYKCFLRRFNGETVELLETVRKPD
jgi:hypothetical protein